ncbi:hypothetical protein AOLI_G00072300 [Acnodon oligacanthus]
MKGILFPEPDRSALLSVKKKNKKKHELCARSFCVLSYIYQQVVTEIISSSVVGVGKQASQCLRQETPYSAAASIRVKCVAKYSSTRAESFDVVDVVVAVKSSRLVVACALSNSNECVVAHLKDDDCSRLQEGQSYYIKHYKLISRYGQKKLFFCPSTVIFKTSAVDVSAELDVMCRHAVCPPSKPYERPGSAGDYYTLEGDVIRLSATHLQSTKNGPVAVQDITLQCTGSQIDITLWREAALNDIALGERRTVMHLRVQRRGRLNSTSYTEKMEIA